MSTHNTALHVNAWIPMVVTIMKQLMHQLNLQQMLVDLHTGLVMVIALMTTIMRNVVGMVEIVVVTMSTHSTALPVNAWIPMVVATMKQLMHQLNLQQLQNPVKMTKLPLGVRTRSKKENVTNPILLINVKKLVGFAENHYFVKTTSPHHGVKTRRLTENVPRMLLNTNVH